jgi:gas vesicle protein
MRGAAVLLMVVSLFGCSQAKQEQAPMAPSSTVEQAVAEVKEGAALVVQEVKKDISTVTEQVTEQVKEKVAPVVEEIKKEVASETAPIVPLPVPEKAVEGGDAAIDKGTWAFSVYDPGTKTTRYYTSTGSLLGKR